MTNTGRGMYYPLWDGAYKRSLAANWTALTVMWQQLISSRYLRGPLLYVQHYITIKKMCRVCH